MKPKMSSITKLFSIFAVLIVIAFIGFNIFRIPKLTGKRFKSKPKIFPIAPEAERRRNGTSVLYSIVSSQQYTTSAQNCQQNARDEILVHNLKFVLIVISHDDKSEAIVNRWCECRPWAKPVRIPTTPFFETIAYRNVLPFYVKDWKDADYVALATYRSIHIMGGIEGLRSKLIFAQIGQCDVVPLVYTKEELMAQAIGGHSIHFTPVWDATLRTMGYSFETIRSADKVTSFYRNSFIVKPSVLVGLIRFMNQAIEAALLDENLAKIMEKDSEYKAGTPGVPEKVFGTRYYQWHPFIFERLPIFYFFVNNISVSFM